MYWKTFNHSPAPDYLKCKNWDDGDGGFECYHNVLRALYNAKPFIAQVEASGRSFRNTPSSTSFETIKIAKVYRWTLNDSRALAQFVFDLVISEIQKNKILKKKDLNAISNPLDASELALEDALYEFYSYFPYEYQYDASHLRQLIYSYEEVVRTEKEDKAQREAAEAAYAAIQVMSAFDKDVKSMILDFIKKRLEES